MSCRPVLVLPLLVGAWISTSGDANAQGFLQRLRNRIAPIVENQLDQRSPESRLPARPLPGSTGAESAIPPLSPPASGRSRLTPTPAIPPGGVEQAGGTSPEPAPPNALGRSVLSPLGLAGESANRASGAAAASIGISGSNANPGYPAVEVTGIARESLAARGGLRVGDYLFAIDASPTPTVQALAARVATYQPGDRVRLRIGRAGRVSDIEIQLIAKPAPPTGQPRQPSADSSPSPVANLRPTNEPSVSAGGRGMSGSSATQQIIGATFEKVSGRRGVAVKQVRSGSRAEQVGLQVGDRIVAVNRKMVSDPAALVGWIQDSSPQSPASLQVIRNNQLLGLEVTATGDQSVSGDQSDPSKAAGDVSAAPSAPTDAQKTPTPASGADKIVNGLGSVFGGLLGGKGGAAAGKEMAELPSPSPSSQPTTESSELPEPVSDPLALDAPATSATAEKSDGAAAGKTAGDDAQLRAEIKRLREQLQALEKKLND